MSQSYRSLLLAAMCCAALCACNDDDDDVVVREDPDVDFDDYKTFAISEQTDDTLPSDVATNLSSANSEIIEQLEAKGLRYVDIDDDPDLIAFSVASTDEVTDVSWDCVPGYWYGYWSFSYDPCEFVSPYYDEYTVGTLVVGLADPERDEVVFAGVAQSVLDGTDPEDDIEQAVDDIFDKYPGRVVSPD